MKSVFYFLFFQMRLDPLALIASTAEELSLQQLKAGEFDPALDTGRWEDFCLKHQIGAVRFWTPDYPAALGIHSTPYFLFYQGNLSLLQQPILGIVGPRNPSRYGIQVLEAFFEEAKDYALVTVSGFAKGIDQKAHQLSLQQGIPTIAVLGAGFQQYLRGSDRWFLQEIVDRGGLVLSEFRLGFQATKRSFPQRNKLIARLSKSLFLPEAREKSGSLITAEFAYQMGKSVVSVPAPLFAPQSAGIFSKMEEQKIHLISDFQAYFRQHFWVQQEKKLIPALELNPLQHQLLTCFSEQGEWAIEGLLPQIGIGYQELLQELTFLEMKKLIEEAAPGLYRKR